MTRIILIKTDCLVLVLVTNLKNEIKMIRINPSNRCHPCSLFLPYLLKRYISFNVTLVCENFESVWFQGDRYSVPVNLEIISKSSL
jgi:hypothetical protein